MTSARLTGCLALWCLVSTIGPRAQTRTAQDSMPVFRVETRLVEVDVHVRDRGGDFVRGLTAEDFEILEDGVPQEVMLLSQVDLPLDRRGRPVRENPTLSTPSSSPLADRSSAAVDVPGRLYVMILDSGPRAMVLRVAQQFIDELLGPDDLLAVVHTGRPANAWQGLTNDKASLLTAVERFSELRTRAGLDSFRLLHEMAIHLNAVSGRRKSILFISGGAPPGLLWLDDPKRWADDDEARRRDAWRLLNEALDTAGRNNVPVHTIDPAGLPPARADLTSEAGGFVESGMTRLEAMAQRVPQGDPVASLRMIAGDTGGRAIVNTNNVAGNLRQVVRDQSAYYVLGYYSTAPRDGALHRITVRVTRPDVSVRARSTYRAPLADVRGPAVALPATLSRAAGNVLRGTTPADGRVQVSVSPLVFRGDGVNGSVVVESRVAGGGLSLRGGDRLELAYAAIDSWGQIRAAGREAFTLTPGPRTGARVEAEGLRFARRLALTPGRYEIRVAVHQPGTGTGAAAAHVEVPHFAERALGISDLAVTSSRADRAVTLIDDDRLRTALPAPPTARRRFEPAETLAIYGEIYDSHWLLASRLGVRRTIAREDGGVVRQNDQTLDTAEGGVFHYHDTVDLAALGPGAYMLTVEAHTTAGIPSATSQQIRFEVDHEP